ncbi:polysaccharide lyase 8 family protein [Parenemella sanctibonifatiensis]|uniref:Hyaluronate lyase n=1 Tax=Parenemella sanctibonifatiensis TaxID=2016505 RepID=A0A255E0V8_9ACTN|nr:polysaccharide lyase 8 family protein [Parenemella sanctibonifatiensis]OYN85126.1 hyaluronate lyase [Parenemella sanctibonifatiensis]
MSTPLTLDALRERWVDLVTGRQQISAEPEAYAAGIQSRDDRVDTDLARLDPRQNQVFGDLDLAADPDVTATYDRFERIAVAWATPGSRHHDNEQTLTALVTGLREANRIVYRAGQEPFGNWWTWQIGCPKALSTSMAILHDVLPEADLAAYAAAIDHFLPDPWLNVWGNRPQTGANRVDTCQAVIVRALAVPDPEKIRHAVAGLPETWDTVITHDGFYADGSFIQHGTVPYAGTYGTVWLIGIARIIALLADSDHLPGGLADSLAARVADSFAPWVFNGQLSDAVSGRGVSRYAAQGDVRATALIEAMLLLSRGVSESYADHWRGLCQGWIATNRAYGSDILDGATVTRTALVRELLDSGVAPIDLPTGPRLYAAMDRLTHRGQGWSVTLSMCSPRIAWYECGNGENNLAVQTGQGMTELHLDSDPQQFLDGFWATFDITAPAGTTVDHTPLPPRTEGEWANSMPPAEWAGGTLLAEEALAGQHLVGPGGTGLRARRTWWFQPRGWLSLAADVHTESGAAVSTVVEHRKVVPGTSLIVDGEVVTEATVANPRWAHLAGVGGYIFLAPASLRAGVAERTGSWRDNHHSGPTEGLRRSYATLQLDHTGHETAAWLFLPGVGQAQTAAAAASPGVTILRNDATGQAARSGDTLALNGWAALECDCVAIDRAASLLLRRGDQWELAVSDPTQQAERLEVAVQGRFELAAPDGRVTDEGVTVETSAQQTRLRITTTGRAGSPATITLRPLP